MTMRDAYYQSLNEQYEKDGEYALERFQGEAQCFARSRKNFMIDKTRSRWTPSDGEREEVLVSFLADIKASKQAVVAEKEALIKASKNATDAKYSPGRESYSVALGIAEELWKNGDYRTHDKMLVHLVGKNGSSPGTPEKFHYLSKFDESCGYTCNGLRDKLKELAYKIDKRLVRGLKK